MIQSFVRSSLTFARANATFRAGVWYTLGNIVIKFLGFAALPIFTRLLTPSEYGVVAVFLTWMSILTIITTLYVHAVPLRARFDFDEDYPQVISALTTLGMITSLGFAVFLAVMPGKFLQQIFDLPGEFIILAAFSVPVVLPFRMVLGIWQGEAKARSYILVTLVQTVLVIVASVVFILLPRYTSLSYSRIWGRIAGILMVELAMGLLYLPIVLKGGVFFNWKAWRYGLLYALPLVPHALSEQLLANFDRVMISHYIGEDEAGIYSFAYQFGGIIALIAAASSGAWFFWFYQQMKQANYARIRQVGTYYNLGFMGLTATGIVSSIIIVPLITPPAYQKATLIVPIIMASGYFLFLQYFFTAVETHFHRTWYTSIGTLLAAGFNIGLNFYFIPRYGSFAAAWTTLISYILLFLVHVAVVRWWLQIEDVNDLRVILMTAFLISMLVTVIYLNFNSG